jgi:hypothetical protein
MGSSLHSASASTFFRSPRFRYVGSIHDGHHIEERPRLFLATTRWDAHREYPGRIVHTVARMGVPLVHVIEVYPLCAR